MDDDPDIRELVALKLGQAGFRVRAEGDGASGLRAALEEDFDLVLLDVMMPHLSGTEVCRRLREEARTAMTPVVMLTARASTGDVEWGFLSGADDYIIKPFSPRDLLRSVSALTG